MTTGTLVVLLMGFCTVGAAVALAVALVRLQTLRSAARKMRDE